MQWFRKEVMNWGQDNFYRFPWRFAKNKWHCLVAEIMLQRTRAEQVEPVYVKFTDRYKNPQDYLVDLGMNVFTNLGLPERERQFLLLNKIINENGIPDKKDDLLKLPGIGDYIASAFLSLHLGIRAFLIDSNVVRLYGRFFGFATDSETRRKKWFREFADKMTPSRNHRTYNYALIDFSRQICKSRPECQICPIRKRCSYRNGG